jgi:hypothetical protein
VWGQVSAADPDVKITWAGVFEELIGRLNSSDLMLMSSEYLLDQFAGILFRWFAIFRRDFVRDERRFGLRKQVSAMLLLRDMLRRIGFNPVDLAKYEVKAGEFENETCGSELGR